MSTILGGLNDGLKKSNITIIQDLFEITTVNKFRCKTCNFETKSKNMDKSFIVFLQTCNSTSNRLTLEKCFKDKSNESDIEWNCGDKKCENNNSTVSVHFVKLPEILIVRLKTSLNDNNSIEYSTKLNLSNNLINHEKTTYNLIGVITHESTRAGGHCI